MILGVLSDFNAILSPAVQSFIKIFSLIFLFLQEILIWSRYFLYHNNSPANLVHSWVYFIGAFNLFIYTFSAPIYQNSNNKSKGYLINIANITATIPGIGISVTVINTKNKDAKKTGIIRVVHLVALTICFTCGIKSWIHHLLKQ